MSIATGTRLGVYEVIALLGAGGMGQVYRARDTKLNRYVAIKVLPSDVARDPDRLARFTREAQTLAALNHPNIAHIHGLEEFDGVVALIMELVEGNDLSALIAGGPMPIAEALPIARQIAEALEAAHEEGFIHRDLKPANVKVRPDGTVKLLDFGLAKALSQDDPNEISGTLANSPTVASPAMTAMGVILGTAAYMAPEQARGKGVDRRVDIWAFGVVFYEMLTGVRLFEGESVAETLGLIFSREPDLTRLPAGTPAGIRRIIGRCLVKDPRQRLRDAGDARLLIDDALEGRGDPAASGPASAPVSPPVHGRGWLLPAGAIAVALAAGAAGWFAKPAPATPSIHLSIALSPGQQVTSAPAISPDGRTVAYVAGHAAGTAQMYLRDIDSFDSRVVAGSAGAQYPFFSPDGRAVGFFSGGRLRRVSVEGGAPVDLAAAPAAWGGTWCADGSIVYASSLGSGLWRVGPEAPNPVQLTSPDGADKGYAHVFPQRLPGTNDLLFSFWGQTFYAAILTATDNTWRQVTPAQPRNFATTIYSPTGHLLGNDLAGSVTAVKWSPSASGQATAETPVLQNVYWGVASDRSWISVADNGTMVFVPGNAANRRVAWVDRHGAIDLLPGEASMIYQATLSHDGTRIGLGALKNQWILDLNTGVRTRVVSDLSSWFGGWLPGDERIVFSSNRTGDWDLYTVSVNGGDITPLLKRPYAQHAEAVAPDGSIIFMERQPATGNDLWVLKPDGRTVPLVVTRFNETSASISPEGRYVAYVSDESGHDEVYAIPASGVGPRTTVSLDGGSGPVWSRDGRELFYRAGDDLIGVQVKQGTKLEFGPRQKVLDISGYDPGYLHDFDVSPDGRRFLLIRTAPESRPTRLDLVLNWSEELRKLGGK